MKDIARDLGVSVVTVSKVLRNHPDISPETRERVLKRMKELNYQPNYAARALVTGRTFCVGLIVPDLVHPFFAEVAKGLGRALRQRGYALLIASSEENPELECQEIGHMLARNVEALVVASTHGSPEHFRQIAERGVPLVLVDRRLDGLQAHFVGIDDEQAGALATEHLIEVGCRRIAHIRGPALSTALGRLAGYRRALDRHGIKVPSEYVVTEETADDAGDVSGRQAMERLLKLNPRPDGVFCYNDPAAMGAMMAILDAGLRIPDDIAVIGCGNVVYAPFLTVPLSSIDQGSGEIGIRAGELALRLVESPELSLPPQAILTAPKLVARASTERRPGVRLGLRST